MHAILTAITLTLLILLPDGNAGAAIYSYKDEQGRTIFVDDEYKVPAKYRSNTAIIQEQRSQPAPTADTGTDDAPTDSAAVPVGEDEASGVPARAVIDRETEQRARQQVEQLERERAYQSPVMVRGNRVLVPVEVGVGSHTVHLMLLLDTGATSTVLHRTAVKELPFAPGEQINARVAGGRTVKSEKVTARSIEVGPFKLKDFPVMLVSPQGSSLPFDGMLGMDFLKTHPHEIDYANEVIRWKVTP